ncbi:MAG: 30S ribosomal protein S16 [Anaerolineae bacterium]|nr:30S ribosomal protein S16 [Anaerolineae bacterium]
MVRIRLRRVGRKKQPSYRIVVTDSRSPRDGRYIEIIGFYNPRTQPDTMAVEEDRALHWLSVGAQPSDAVRRILGKTGTLARYERLCKGEALETLVQEAQAAASEQGAISPKTSYPPMSKEAKAAVKAARAEAASEEEVAEAVEAAEEASDEVVEDAEVADEMVEDAEEAGAAEDTEPAETE